ncbi:hypothetical protein HN51_009575 [Arachis hypogaea]|uniref:uncharacterized protein n=1 Tax=Arachis hypogaea TaxID=3818 RepID=UPI000DECFD6A|nr:uncharacterized protein LOC112802954 [Arachis hypogaea]
MMESAETGACLWMVTDDKIFGIRIEKLEKLGKNEVRDWKSHLEPAPFDFHLELPEPTMLYPFIFHSKLFLLGDPTDSGTKIYQISYVGGDTLDISEAAVLGAIPPLPTGRPGYIANIQDDVYLVGYRETPGGLETGLWVLSSRSGKWDSLSIPPTVLPDLCRSLPSGFVLNDKLFFHCSSAPPIHRAYDPRTLRWEKTERAFSSSDRQFHRPLVLVSSLGDVDNCRVVLTWDLRGLPCEDGVKYDIHALLVDNEDYCVRGHQFLDELCKAIQPSYFDSSSIEMNAVDLGNSKVCIIMGGLAEGIPSLSILVVELGLVEGEEQRFLSVRVLVNQVYDTMPYLEDDGLQVLNTSFIFSLTKGMPRKHPYSQDCISPRKEPKLAGGTNPNNPTRAFKQE